MLFDTFKYVISHIWVYENVNKELIINESVIMLKDNVIYEGTDLMINPLELDLIDELDDTNIYII